MTSRRTTACYPGCEKNEAHAKKYHKDKEAGKINYRDNFTNQVAANVSRGEAAGYRQGHSAEQGQSRAVRGVSPTTSLDAKTGSDHLAGRLLRGLRYLQSAGAVGEPSGQRQGARSAKRTGVRLYKDVLQSNDPQKHFDLRCLNCQLLYEYQTGKVSLPTSEEFSVLQAHLKDSSTT